MFIEYFSGNPMLFAAVVLLLGAIVGSFLNVVIHRLPKMMENQWHQQCAELAAQDRGESVSEIQAETYNLATPDSHCPKCGHKIRAWENIPVVSYLFLRGKCSGCGTAISVRYPIIEGVTALLSAFVAWHFGWGWEAGAALLLTWALVALTVIDFDHQLLPDDITLPWLWLGLGLALFGLFTNIESAVIGAIAGYISLWSIYWGFKLLTGKEGMGYGDFKLLAMLGAWMGWQALPVVILMSSVVGAAVGITLIVIRGRDRNVPIPFGPYLAAAGWITLIWGHDISNAYLQFAGVPS